MIYIETERLILRDWTKDDEETFHNMNADPEVMRYFPSTSTLKESKDFLRKIKEEITDKGYGLYPVEVKETGKFIGYIGLHLSTFEADFTPCVEIGWRLIKESWRNGYATEGALALLKYGFEELELEEIYSFTAKMNTPSENVMKRIGLQYLKDFEHPKVDVDELVDHVLYRIDRAKFQSTKDG